MRVLHLPFLSSLGLSFSPLSPLHFNPTPLFHFFLSMAWLEMYTNFETPSVHPKAKVPSLSTSRYFCQSVLLALSFPACLSRLFVRLLLLLSVSLLLLSVCFMLFYQYGRLLYSPLTASRSWYVFFNGNLGFALCMLLPSLKKFVYGYVMFG